MVEQSKPNMNDIPTLIKMLDQLYDKEEKLTVEIKKLMAIHKQLQDDKEMLQTLIMYQINKKARRY